MAGSRLRFFFVFAVVFGTFRNVWKFLIFFFKLSVSLCLSLLNYAGNLGGYFLDRTWKDDNGGDGGETVNHFNQAT